MLARLGRWIAKRLSPMQEMISWRAMSLAGATHSKVSVNERAALGLAAFFACIKVIAETKASLPIHVYEYSADGRGRVTSHDGRVMQHDVAGLLGTEPNHDQTPMVWSEYRQAQCLCSGNSYTEIVLDGRGRASALIPRAWQDVEPFRDDDGSLMYSVSDSAGGTRTLDRSEMLHVPALGNGIVGWSPIRMHAETLGIALGADRFAATYFGNGVKPSMVLSTPGQLDPVTKKNLERDLDERYTNDNAHRAIIAEGGLTVTPLSIPMDEAQFLESRIFELQEVARIFRVPPHMIGDLSRATFSNVEAQDLSFEKHTIRPWLVRDEQELKRKLFTRSEWGRFYVKHNVDALLRADVKTRFEAYKTAILCGIRTQNECRALEDLDPVEGGDRLLLPEAIFGKSGGDPNSSGDGKGDANQGSAKDG